MDKYLEQLNPSQKESVLNNQGPLIIFAGAGTGKTRVITYKIAYLLAQGVNPLNILAVTFTNKAAEEMRNRVSMLTSGCGKGVWISTFHSFGAQLLRTEAKHLGLNPDFLIYDDTDQKKVLQECIRELNLDEKKFKPARILEVISRAKDDLLDADSYGIHSMTSGDYFRQIVATIYGVYQKKLNKAGALDFGDLLMATVTALRDKEILREKYQHRFKYILVDEYQDTNHAQYMLTKYLASKHKNICVVGDDDQSIYSWRGADIRNILEFERDYPGCKMVKLEKNYRSTAPILNAAWQVIKNNQNRVEKKLWTENKIGSEPYFVENNTELDEAQKIVSEIEYWQSEKGFSLSNFAVFYRTNAQSRVLEDAFRRAGIPYRIVGSVRFYARAEIKDIMAYLRLIHNPNDGVSFKRIINVPRRKIGKASIDSLEAYSMEKNITLWDALKEVNSLDLAPSAKRAFNGFRKLIEELQEQKDFLTVKEIAVMVLEKTQYIQELEQEDSPEAKNRIDNLKELISAIDEFEQRSPDKSLAGYLTQIALVTDLDDYNSEEEKATLMTLHLAKGLEFKVVFITGLEEGLFPIGEAAFAMDDLEEERRLMYVGMTRAKEHLYLTWANERKVFGKTNWNIPSRFLNEAHVREEKPKIKEPVKEVRHTLQDTISNTLYALGTRVKHPKFGQGKVIDKSGTGDDLKLVVLFDSGQWKKLLVKYANLEKI